MKETEDVSQRKDVLSSWIGRVNIVNSYYSAVYRVNVVLIKIPVGHFFTEIAQIILKFVWNHEKPQIAKAILKKKNKAGNIRLPVLPSGVPLAVSADLFGCHKLGSGVMLLDTPRCPPALEHLLSPQQSLLPTSAQKGETPCCVNFTSVFLATCYLLYYPLYGWESVP